MRRRLSPRIAPLVLVLPLLACAAEKEMKVTGVSPQAGHVAGDQTVQILGKNLRTDIGYTVYFGNARARSVTIRSDSALAVTTPPGRPGPVDLMVRADDGHTFVLDDAFRYEDMSGSVVEGLGETAVPKKKGNLAY